MSAGGRPRLSVEAHKLRGTYKATRHGPKPRRVIKLAATSPHEIPESWPPFRLSSVTDAEIQVGDGQKYIDFISRHCRVTMDSIAARAREPLVLRRWQQELVRRIFARREDGRLRHRQALVGMGRKNGKSVLIAGIGLADLVLGPEGGQIYSCAAEKEQARIVFGTARRMVELDPWLGERLKLYRDFIENPATGSIYRVLSAEAYSKEGLNPHRVIVDEVHALPDRGLWDVMALAQGSRQDPLMIGITTPGVMVDAKGQDSLCYQLYLQGCQVASGELEDPSFFMAWWEPARDDADYRLEATWKQGNPGYGDLNDPEDFRQMVVRTPEAEFRTKRCAQWSPTSAAWLPWGIWDLRAAERSIPDGSAVVLSFDGSYNNDSTALVVVSLAGTPHIDVAGLWQKPDNAGNSWKVPIVEVEEAIRKACARWDVQEIIFDPFRWRRTMEILEAEHLPIVEFQNTPERMVPATQRFYEAVVNGTLTHSGDPQLARHVGNCTIEISQRGTRIVKDKRNSGRKIDLAICAVTGFDRAVFLGADYRLLDSVA